jgi:hypothetical protein
MKTAPIPRHQIVQRAQIALAVGEGRYARRLTLAWLTLYPGDLPMALLHARALLCDGLPGQALVNLETLCESDPEYLEGYQVQLETRKLIGANGLTETAGAIYALDGPLAASTNLPPWTERLRDARHALAAGNGEAATKLLQPLLHLEDTLPLVAVTRLRILQIRQAPAWARLKLSTRIQQHWPHCLPALLVEAEALMDDGRGDEAVERLHRAASLDVTGQVAERWWGREYPYRALWPACLEAGSYGPSALHNIPIPANVAAALGQNLLGEGSEGLKVEGLQVYTLKVENKQVASGQASELADQQIGKSTNLPTCKPVNLPPANLPNHQPANPSPLPDGRFPAYVILSTRRGLAVQYGDAAMAAVEQALQQLAESVRAGLERDAFLLFADDPQSAGALGLKAVAHNDAWGIKRLLADVDAALAQRGERIGALLIVGGPGVVPFHHLPNPVDDADSDVPSDNPYACRDENYFTPEWPVGRLPGDGSQDPSVLLHSLAAMAGRHRQRYAAKKQNWWQTLQGWLQERFLGRGHTGMGYTAAVWQRSSQAVYRALRSNGLGTRSVLSTRGVLPALLVSPPLEAGQVKLDQPAQVAYFNLHGIPDAAVWYGQRDPTQPGDGPHFPVALRPQDVRNSGNAPQIIFSEACYGAHIVDKTMEQALALKFLSAGSRAVIGSTCTSYGSVGMPLIAADWLGRAFWEALQAGLPAGEALRRAKIGLVQEMLKRQGYLDGEDQKTLISFVLYGDPLAQPGEKQARWLPAAPVGPNEPIPTVNDSPAELDTLQPELMAHVKQAVAHYLPGMDGAETVLSRQSRVSNGAKSFIAAPSVITLRKTVSQGAQQHQQMARLAVDEQGQVIKLVVSR